MTLKGLACKAQVNGEEVMAGLPPAYDLMINIFTTQRALDAGSP